MKRLRDKTHSKNSEPQEISMVISIVARCSSLASTSSSPYDIQFSRVPVCGVLLIVFTHVCRFFFCQQKWLST